MTNGRRTVYALTCCLILLTSVASFAGSLPTRGSSKNGITELSANWNIFGPTAVDTRHNGDLTIRTQYVCANQDFVNAQNPSDFEDSGTCLTDSKGRYIFIYQFQGTVSKITLGGLVGFTPDNGSVTGDQTYGLISCDDANTGELCSNLTDLSADNQTKLDNITTTIPKKNNKVTFSIPAFPQLPPGTDKQGQGLTLFVITEQPQGAPVVVPKIGLNFQ